MTCKDLSADQWREIEAKVMQAWRAAYDVAQIAVDAELSHDDPLFHHAGALLGAACDMRRLLSAVAEGTPLPKVVPGTTRSMMGWVRPHDGGGCVPRKGK